MMLLRPICFTATVAAYAGPIAHISLKWSGRAQRPLTTATVLDGFAIYGGDNSASYAYVVGAGLSCTVTDSLAVCAPSLTNLIFVGNHSGVGGALVAINDYNSNDFEITPSVFEGNSAEYGGAILIAIQGAVRISDCAFINNVGTSEGGAVLTASAVVAKNSRFYGNTAKYGGALYFSRDVFGSFSSNLANMTGNHRTTLSFATGFSNQGDP